MIAARLLGNTGSILIMTMIAMTLMSTGSGEVMAVSSIIVYDIYQVYINPFRFVQPVRLTLLLNRRVCDIYIVNPRNIVPRDAINGIVG